jgi:hypothetical protein
VNPINFVRPLLVFLARVIAGTQKTERGTDNLREKWLPFASEEQKGKEVAYKGGLDQTAMRFLQSKLHPTAGTILSLATAKQFGGRKDQTVAGAAKDASIPLTPRQAWSILMTEDPDAAVVLSSLNFLGFDVKPDYSSPVIMKHEAENDEEFKKKVGSVVYNATSPKADDGDRAMAKKVLAGKTDEDVRGILRETVKARGGKARTRTASGKLTAYGKRLARLNAVED